MFENKSIIAVLSVLAGFVTVIIVLRVVDGSPPTVTFSTPFDVVGSKMALRLRVEDMRTGLK
ncbi:MAG TPA: hypothetical protein EYN74_09825, partial [Nitrospirales bacterium]|nr:hypothetical protein [Nitrospirales bacterium]